MLLEHGADMTATDYPDKLSIWHTAAANNDTVFLEALIAASKPHVQSHSPPPFPCWPPSSSPANKQRCIHREETEAALRRVDGRGRTPLAHAFLFVRELIGHSPRAGSRLLKPDAALLLLDHCRGKDPAYFQSDIPLIHLAAEWGSETLVRGLARASGADLAALSGDGSGALHCVNFGANSDFISLLKSECPGLPVQNRDGKTAIETIFFNFKDERPGEYSGQHGHPSCLLMMDVVGFDALLSPEAVASTDDRGRTLWERFCDDASAHYAKESRLWPRVEPMFPLAINALVRAGAPRAYEEQHGKSALLPLMAGNLGEKSKLLPSWALPGAVEVLRVTQCFDAVKDDPSVLLTLRTAIHANMAQLVEDLLSRGVSLHLPARGVSALDEACLPGKCSCTSSTTCSCTPTRRS